jgi:hypothetical protein
VLDEALVVVVAAVVYGLGFRVKGLGFGVWGLGMKITKNGFGVWGLGMKITKNGF